MASHHHPPLAYDGKVLEALQEAFREGWRQLSIKHPSRDWAKTAI